MSGLFRITGVERLFSGKHPNPTTLLILDLLLITFARIFRIFHTLNFIYRKLSLCGDSFIYDTECMRECWRSKM
ncbi:predicted protein [Methanosarcina acetivorans C2A]|uniref:Uncharacterized protein n=1 Tax=Methanosarcina acetivorans (strain ATCC 35395 / DSM 2834 / JCM 12185 / C2A) TaxID=188937 RepID=Q8TLA7_METAC|nr:predicted protein [Methanosarcina acetivorans C2A]